jgi:hypothetical protein
MKFSTFHLQIPKHDSKVYHPKSVLGKQRVGCNWIQLKTRITSKPCDQMPPNLNRRDIIKFTTTLVYNIEHENNHNIAQITHL